MTKTIMVMAGGTGGHIYPGLAVAAVLAAKDWRVVWLGTRRGMEARIVPSHGYDMAWLSMGGMRGKGWLRQLLMPAMLLLSMGQAIAALLRFRPDVVLGMGGYPSLPGGLMSALLGRPLLIHEQNSIAGLSNRVLACVANKVMTGFPAALQQKNDKPLFCMNITTEWVGNPVRENMVSAVREDKTTRTGCLRVLVVGGSLGAVALNEVVPQALALMPMDNRPEVVHQAGARHIDTLRTNYAHAHVEADVRDYIHDMAEMYAWCDVAITRAGALTLAELAVAGVPALLVPYPHAVDDHQTHNADFLVACGAAQLMPQAHLTAESLAAILQQLDRQQLAHMAQQALHVAKPDAAVTVARWCEEATG